MTKTIKLYRGFPSLDCGATACTLLFHPAVLRNMEYPKVGHIVWDKLERPVTTRLLLVRRMVAQ